MFVPAIAIEALVKILLLVSALMTGAAYFVLVERWIAAWIQDRRGPNRAGIPLTRFRLWGLGQPIADGVKFFFKEEFTPGHVDRLLYRLAPILLFTAAVVAFAAIPFGSVLPGGLFPPNWGVVEPIRLVVAPGLDVGILFVLAAGGAAVHGVLLAGWSSNNKYSLFGALRSAAQLISYEIPLGLGVLCVVVAAGSLRLEEIIAQQARAGVWNALSQPLAMLVFGVAAWAEAGRLPFDLAEAEQELVGGYHTEYSGMKLMLLLVSEYLHMFIASVLLVVLFLGGWHCWGLTGAGEQVGWIEAFVRVGVLLAKVVAVVFFFMLARWSWPRFRFDQLMALAWKVLVPLAMVQLVAAAVWAEYGVRIAAALGVSPAWPGCALGWAVLLAAGAAAVALAPPGADNRPRAVVGR